MPSAIGDHVVRLGSPLVNWYLVEDGGRVTVVDAGLPGYRDQLPEALRQLRRSESDIAAVVLTHAHADHVGVAEMLRADLDVPVYVHEADAEMARTGKRQGKTEGSFFPLLRNGATWKILSETMRNGAIRPRPIRELETYADGDELDVPGKLRAIHTPGHSDGHCALLAEAPGAVFVGDALCTLNPFTGEVAPQLMPSALNRDTAQALWSLGRLSGSGVGVLLPGHGEPARDPDAAIADAQRHDKT
jgi:glyoxylase-like metal-dependent hydrolase (beta-lactamase superfamily II)